MIKHHPKCWTGFTERLVTNWEPNYTDQFDEEQCSECLVLRGYLVPESKDSFKLKRVEPNPWKKLKTWVEERK